MKQFAKPFLSIVLLLSTAAVFARHHSSDTNFDCDRGCSTDTVSVDTGCSTGCSIDDETRTRGCGDCGSSVFLPRPQYLDTAAFFNPFLYGPDAGDSCFTSFVGFRYQQTFKGNRIAQCLFGTDRLIFEGSEVTDRREGSLVADNFGLSPNFRGNVKFNPRIRDYMVDFSARWDLGPWIECLEGTWFLMNATAVHSKWDLRGCYTNESASPQDGNYNFPACYMSDEGSVPAKTSLQDALVGENWQYGNFRGSKSKTGLADIEMQLGYDFLLCDDYHVGAFIRALAPTGNRPDAKYVFSPIIGNGHHWELGGGLMAHYEVWNCDDQSVSLWLNGHAEHLFKDHQYRSFDFNSRPAVDGQDRLDGCMSRYMLLKEFNDAGQFTGNIENAINVNTRKIESSFGVQGDASLRLLYRACGWAVGVGYNVYGRSQEKIQDRFNNCCPDNRHFGIKGTTGVCAFSETGEQIIPLVATQTGTARIYAVTEEVDNQVPVAGVAWNGEPAFDSQLNGVDAPLILTGANINFKEIPRQISHKFFAHVDYQWEDCDCQPYMGLGGEVEFAQNGKKELCTANKWGVWLRTGVSF